VAPAWDRPSAPAGGRAPSELHAAERVVEGLLLRHPHSLRIPSRFIFRQSVVVETPSSRATFSMLPPFLSSRHRIALRSARRPLPQRPTPLASASAARGPGFQEDFVRLDSRPRARAPPPARPRSPARDVFRGSRTSLSSAARLRQRPPGPVPLVEAGEEVLRQERDVLLAYAAAAPARHHVEPVVQVLAKRFSAIADLRSWLLAAITRTSTGMEALSPTRRSRAPDHPQELRWKAGVVSRSRRRRRCRRSPLQEPLPQLDRAGERSLDVPNSSLPAASRRSRRNSPARRGGSPPRVDVDGPREQLLARAALPR